MNNKGQHYSTAFPDVNVKIYSISASLRRHLYLFKTITGVFSFKKIDLGTKILVKNMKIPDSSSVLLDLGCGYGVIGIVLSKESPLSQVYMIDINQRAIWCTKENIKINIPDSKNQTIVLKGNYFEPLIKNNVKFDAIYMNPPLRKGRKEFLNLFQELPNYLKKKGFFQFVIKKKMGAEYVLDYLRKKYSEQTVEVLCKRSGYWVFNYVQHQNNTVSPKN
ncbi:MAG: class I SAM-dependent methyltransferase [Candidatus Thorarchaeota archaeon]